MIFGTEPWGTDLIKTDLGYIGPVKPWQTDLYGYELESGVGDWIYNQCRMIMQTEDRSEWAYKIFETCADLLTWRKRWPEEFQNRIPKNRQCKNRAGSFYNKMKFKLCKALKIDCMVKYRSWGDMTRDPYIAFFTCAVFLDRLQFIAIISIPWYLYRPQTWAWHRYLKNPTDKNWDMYNIAYDHDNKSKYEFVNTLRGMRVWSALEIRYLTSIE